MKQFLIGQLSTPQELDLRKVVGCGGESVVIVDKEIDQLEMDRIKEIQSRNRKNGTGIYINS